MKTSIEGIWAAGDIVAGLDQISVAMGHAAVAATCQSITGCPSPSCASRLGQFIFDIILMEQRPIAYWQHWQETQALLRLPGASALR